MAASASRREQRGSMDRTRATWAGGIPVLGFLAVIVALSACAQEGTEATRLELGESDTGVGTPDGGDELPSSGPDRAHPPWTDGGVGDRGGIIACHWDEGHGLTDPLGSFASAPSRVVVHRGDDVATLTLARGVSDAPPQLALSIRGLLDVTYFPSTFYPGNLELRSNIAGNGVLEARFDSTGAMVEGELRGRSLDPASNGQRYADGSPVDLRVPAHAPGDGDERLQALLADLGQGLGNCVSGPLPDDPASCPVSGTRGVSAVSGAANPVGCAACIFGVAQALGFGAAIAALACSGLGNPIAVGICAIIVVLVVCLNSIAETLDHTNRAT